MSTGAFAEPVLWGILVTYRRPEALLDSLRRIAEQSRHVDRMVVVDNDSDNVVREAATAFGATYIDASENSGPAGGIALGMDYVLGLAGESDWLVLFDDDDPPREIHALERLWEFACEHAVREPDLAAVGLTGARFDRRRGIVRRVDDAELVGAVPVDYIGGGQLPMYRCAALMHAGRYGAGLFFGFDDLEFGLRLRQAGYSLLAAGDMWRKERMFHNRLNLPRNVRTVRTTSAWRRYYSVRNIILINRQYAHPAAVLIVTLIGASKATVALIRARRPFGEIALPIRGAIDGLRDRRGRTINPSAGRKGT